MGYKWAVSGWGGDQYISCYYGDSLFSAFLSAIKAKRFGYGCIKIEWRPKRECLKSILSVSNLK